MTTQITTRKLELDKDGFGVVEIPGLGATGYMWFVEKAERVRVFDLPPTPEVQTQTEESDRALVCGAIFPERYLVAGNGRFSFVARRPWMMDAEPARIIDVTVLKNIAYRIRSGLGRAVEDLSGKTKNDYLPHVEVTEQETGFRYDGLIYNGRGKVGDHRVYYTWGDDVETGRGPWERLEMDELGGHPDNVSVEQEIFGFHVFKVYTQTPEQLDLLDRNRAIDAAHPHTPRNDQGPVDQEAWRTRYDTVRREQKEAGCSWDDITKSNNEFPPENFLGYFFTDGLEIPEATYWSGYREVLLNEPQEIQDFVNNTPEMSDEPGS